MKPIPCRWYVDNSDLFYSTPNNSWVVLTSQKRDINGSIKQLYYKCTGISIGQGLVLNTRGQAVTGDDY